MSPLLERSGKDFQFTRHAYDGAHAESIDAIEIFELVAAQPAPPLHEKQENRTRKARRTIIVRWIEREHTIYVLNVSATRST